MEHMKARWIAVLEADHWNVRTTDDKIGWYLFEVAKFLPGDVEGEVTAKLICDMHNAALDKAG